jgi:serine/threonine protein kinase
VSETYHPSLLPLLEVLEVDGSSLHLVTELCAGAVLGDAIFNVVMSEQACRLIMVQLTSAVAHLHAVCGLCHRDVKPDNVLCAAEDPTQIGCLKLADFGLCQPFADRRAAAYTEPCGTCDYFSPELAEAFRDFLSAGKPAEPTYGAPVDVWALGCVCYELMHGYPPYTDPGAGEMAAIDAVCAANDVPMPAATFSAVSADGVAFLRALLTRSTAARPLAEEALAHAWLQPVQVESLRVQMAADVPEDVNVRREKRRQGMRAAGLKVVAAQWISTPQKPATPQKAPRRLARAPSTVKSTRALLAPPASPLRPSAPLQVAVDEVDPMLHYVTVYSPAKGKPLDRALDA